MCPSRFLKLFALCLTLVAVRASAGERIVVLRLASAGEGATALADALTEQVLTELQHAGVSAVGQSDVAAILGLERQKELLGCADKATSCLAELTGALGAAYLLTGALSRAGESWRLDLKLLRASNGEVLRREGLSSVSSGLYDGVSTLVKRLLEALPSPSGASSGPGPRLAPWLIGGVGVLAGVGGAVLLDVGLTGKKSVSDNKATISYSDAATQLKQAATETTAGLVLASVGVAAVATGVVLLLLPQAPVQAAVSVTPGGAGLVIGGSF
jgi:TolB-like protein